jgi:hypothetical protein
MSRFRTAILAALAFAPATLAAGHFDTLLSAVPPQVNTLVLVNVKAAYASPLARNEKWADDFYHRYKSGTGFVPPDAEAVVIASTVNLSTMTRDHQIGLVKVTGLPSATALATRENGTVSEVAGQPFILSPRDVYFTTLTREAAIAAIYPADRQASARWVRYASTSKTIDLAPYLKQAADAAGEDVLTIAVDLADSQDATLLKVGLATSPAVVKQKGVDIGRVARFISTVRGLTFSARVGETITGTIRVDFTEDPAPVKTILRELFLELLDDQGVAVPGLEQWQTTYGTTSMTLTGTLTTLDLRRIMSLFAFPGATSPDAPQVTPGEISRPATLRYWSAVNTVLADLRNTKDSPDYAKTATWHEKAANQLDHLNRNGIDPLAVEVAHEAARRIRAVGASLRGVPIDLDSISRKGYAYSSPSVGYSLSWWGGIRPVWYGPGAVSTNYPQIRAEAESVIANDQKRRIETWNQIDQLMSDTRRKLSDKYKGGF